MDKDQQGKVLDLMKLESGLTEREIQFLENLHDNYWGRDLTEPQDKWLDDIVFKKL